MTLKKKLGNDERYQAAMLFKKKKPKHGEVHVNGLQRIREWSQYEHDSHEKEPEHVCQEKRTSDTMRTLLKKVLKTMRRCGVEPHEKKWRGATLWVWSSQIHDLMKCRVIGWQERRKDHDLEGVSILWASKERICSRSR